MEYTEGEWTINNWKQATDDISIGAVGTPLIARVPSRDVSYNQQKGNARLIATAPEGYQLAKLVLEYHGHQEDHKLTAIAKKIVAKVEAI